jgi:hypothetical protein
MMFFTDPRDRVGTRHCPIFPSSPSAQFIVTDIAPEIAINSKILTL